MIYKKKYISLDIFILIKILCIVYLGHKGFIKLKSDSRSSEFWIAIDFLLLLFCKRNMNVFAKPNKLAGTNPKTIKT